MTPGDKIRDFYRTHPDIKWAPLTKRAKVGRRNFQEIIKGSEPRQSTFDKLLPWMEYYGYGNKLKP